MCSSRKNPYPPHGRSLEIPRGRGGVKVNILEPKYEAKLEFPGGTGGAKQKTFCGGSMDIFWNCTIQIRVKIVWDNQQMNGSWDAYLASPTDFAGADNIITNLTKERKPGIESSNALPYLRLLRVIIKK